MNILVTGGAGFIGSSIADKLLQTGHHVTIIDNLSTGRLENVPAEAVFHQLDIRSAEIEKVFQERPIDVIYHEAAQMDVRASMRDPINDVDNNVVGSVNLLGLANKYKVKQFIFASTGGVIYGDSDEWPTKESFPTRPICFYGVAKLAVERYAFVYHTEYGMNVACLRYGNVYGPRQNPFGEAGVVAIFARKMLDGDQPMINGDGLTSRDYVFIDDVVRANLLALNLPGYHILNVGTGRETNTLTIFRELNRITGNRAKEQHGPAPLGEQRRSFINSELAGEVLNWHPEMWLEQGMEVTVEYFKRNRR